MQSYERSPTGPGARMPYRPHVDPDLVRPRCLHVTHGVAQGMRDGEPYRVEPLRTRSDCRSASLSIREGVSP